MNRSQSHDSSNTRWYFLLIPMASWPYTVEKCQKNSFLRNLVSGFFYLTFSDKSLRARGEKRPKFKIGQNLIFLTNFDGKRMRSANPETIRLLSSKLSWLAFPNANLAVFMTNTSRDILSTFPSPQMAVGASLFNIIPISTSSRSSVWKNALFISAFFSKNN